MAGLIDKALDRLKRRVLLMVSRGVIRLVNDSLKLQGVQVELLAGEVADGVEHFQQYGFTSVPEDGAEAIVLAVGGNRSHLVVIATGDRRHRKKDGAPGEVAIYHKEGSYVYLKNGGDIEVKGIGKVTVKGAGVDLDGGTPATTGVVNGECLCAFTGAPHPQTSIKVLAGL